MTALKVILGLVLMLGTVVAKADYKERLAGVQELGKLGFTARQVNDLLGVSQEEYRPNFDREIPVKTIEPEAGEQQSFEIQKDPTETLDAAT